jgi:hypothetical protein
MFTLSSSVLLSLALAAAPPEPKRNTEAAPPESKREADGTTPRKPHPLAPSLRETTKAEEDKFDEVIDAFIEADTGKLTGSAAKKANETFQKLPPEAAFALIRGLNKAAAIDNSCPALVIAKKLRSQLRSSTDKQLLQYSRENIGSGVTQSRHMAVIKDLRLGCSLRMHALNNQKPEELRGEP